MAFPTIPTVAANRILFQLATAPAGTHTSPSLTSLTKDLNDLLIAIAIIYDGNSTNAEFSNWGGGFTEFGDFATTTTMGIGCAYKWSTGSETGTFTVTSADTSTNDSCVILLSIPGAHLATPPEAGSYATGTATAANPVSFNPAGWDAEDTLWIAVGGSGETGTGGAYDGISAAPANYTGYADSGISADAVGGVEAAVAFRQLNAASEDVGTFTLDLSNARNAAIVIAVRPAVIYTDASTVYNELTASTTSETAQFADSQTTYFDLQTSGTEERISTDSGSIYLDLQSSGTDELVKTDADTIYFDLQASGVDEIFHEYTDSDTVYFDLQSSGTDLAETVDASTIYNDLQSSGTELSEFIDTATADLRFTPSGTDVSEYTESQTVYLDLQSSGSDTHESGGPKQTTVGRVTFSDINEPSYRTDHRLHVWASLANGAHTGYLGFQLYEGASAIGSELYTATLTGSEVEYVLNIADIDAQSIVDYTDLELAFVGYADTGDSAQFRIHDVQLEVPAAVPVERTDSATVYFDLRTTSTEVAEFADTGSIYFDLQSSGTDIAVFADTDTTYFDLQASGTETLISATQDADTAYFDLQASGTDTPVRTDAEQIYFDLNTFTIDIAEFVDGTTVKLLVLPATTDERISYDSVQVYFDLEAGSILLQVDFLLDIIECTARWVIEKPIKTRWQLIDLITRIVTETAIARWTIMETRRFKWKS